MEDSLPSILTNSGTAVTLLGIVTGTLLAAILLQACFVAYFSNSDDNGLTKSLLDKLSLFAKSSFPLSSSNNDDDDGNHDGKPPTTRNKLKQPAPAKRPPPRERLIRTCPFSEQSTFVMETAPDLDPTPLDQYDTSLWTQAIVDSQSKTDNDTSSPQYLGVRWLAAGVSGQDQAGHLRAQLKRLRHDGHALLVDELLANELRLKERALANPQRYPQVLVHEPTIDTLDAQRETLEFFVAYLPERYPEIYQYDKETHSILLTTPDPPCNRSDNSDNSGPLQRTYRIDDYADRPLELCARLVQEDLVLLRATENDEAFVMAAAAVVFSFNDLPTRLGTDTNFIHAPVPGYEQHLRKTVHLSFKHLKADKPLWRNNWTIVPKGDLDMPSDSVTHNEEHEQFQEDNRPAAAAVRDRFVKVEYQTIRRLPRSQYLLFTIRTFCDPLSSLEQVPPTAAATLAASIRGMMTLTAKNNNSNKSNNKDKTILAVPASIAKATLEYRGIESEAIRDALLDYLDSIVSNPGNSSTFK